MLPDFDTEFWDDLRGSAHTVGYVIMIAIFLAGGLSLFVVSVTVFSDTSSNPVNDAGEQMQKLQSSFNSFTDGAPSREAELTGRDATMTYGDPVEITIEARSNTGADFSDSRSDNIDCDGEWCTLGNAEVTPLVYQVDGGQVEYVNGALLLSQGPNSGIVKSKGPWQISDYARFPLLATQQEPGTSGSVGVSGSGSFTVEGYSQSPITTVWTPDKSEPDEDQNLEVRVTMDGLNNIDAWETYFTNSDSFTGVSTNGDTIEVTFTTDRIIVREIPIDVIYRTGN